MVGFGGGLGGPGGPGQHAHELQLPFGHSYSPGADGPCGASATLEAKTTWLRSGVALRNVMSGMTFWVVPASAEPPNAAPGATLAAVTAHGVPQAARAAQAGRLRAASQEEVRGGNGEEALASRATVAPTAPGPASLQTARR
jgi:hypothetical protein